MQTPKTAQSVFKEVPRAWFWRNQTGQVVIEYVLLMVVLAGIGAAVVRNLVSRDASEPGILVAKWHSLLKVVAEDNPED